MRSPAWTCTICGITHEGLAMVFGPSTPAVQQVLMQMQMLGAAGCGLRRLAP
jgi:hypothetical protein